MNKFYLLRLFLISLLCIPFVNSQDDDTEDDSDSSHTYVIILSQPDTCKDNSILSCAVSGVEFSG